MSLNRTLAGLITTTGDVKSASLDNAASLTVYATKEDLPSSGMSSGDQAYVTGNSRFYISNGSGWYNVALVNATPSLSIDPTGAIELSTTGETTTITLTATDSDNAVAGLTYSVESDGSFGGLATISQDSSVFTITPLSADSATTSSATLTFKASDGINFGSGTRTLTLTFSVENSNYTTLLLKADSDGTDNQVDASTNTHTITEAGNVTSTAFSPYHPGGYSNYITSSGSGYVEWTSPPTFSATAWCVETWFRPDGMPSVAVGNTGHWSIFGCWTANTNNREFLLIGGSSGEIRFYYSFDGSAASYVDTASGVFSDNTWVHLALSFDGTNYTLYADGVNVARVANSTQIANTSSPLSFGKSIDGSGVTQTYVTGWYADGRVINGSTLESSNTFPVPTSRIDYSVANTQALMHHLPHTRQTVTYNGDATIKRAGPYDYLGYAKADHGGSVYFDGTGDYLQLADDTSLALAGTSTYTVEAWIYLKAAPSGNASIITNRDATLTEGYDLRINPNRTIQFYETGGGSVTTSGLCPLNSWTHIAAVKTGGNAYVYVNGALDNSGSFADGTHGNDVTYIGRNSSGTIYYINGYISDLRVVKGTAVYTSNFAAPTAPLTAITNTSLLTCTNKNEFFDASANAPVMTPGGSVAVNTSEVAYTGNSIYFSTRSDEISGNGTLAAFNTLPGDFTIELECKLTSSNMAYAFVFQLYSGSNNDNAIIRFGDSGFGYHLQFVINNGGGTGAVYNVNLVQSDFTSGFRHIAWTRESGTNRVFIDGTQYNVATGSNPSTFTSASWSDSTTISFNNADGIRIGQASYAPLGYLQNIRVTNGLARYTANFTPPTAEFAG